MGGPSAVNVFLCLHLRVIAYLAFWIMVGCATLFHTFLVQDEDIWTDSALNVSANASREERMKMKPIWTKGALTPVETSIVIACHNCANALKVSLPLLQKSTYGTYEVLI